MVVVFGSLVSGVGAASAATPGLTTRVNVASDGAQSTGFAREPSISSDGRYVVFRATSPNLVPGDSNSQGDVFVHDRQTGVTSLVSVASDGTQANNDCYEPTISPNGRFVSYRSGATNLVAGDTNGALDIFVYDMDTRVTSRVSVASDGTQSNGDSYSPSCSADGRYIAYCSFGTNLVSGDGNGAYDIFVHDRETGVTSRASVSSDGVEGSDGCSYPFISADGRYVAFYSDSPNLVADDTNGLGDIFIRDRTAASTSRVSIGPGGAQSNGSSYDPSVSADGRTVIYYSYASNLVVGDTNVRSDVFVFDRDTGVTTRVSIASNGAQSNGQCYSPSISPDGRYLTYDSDASNLVEGDTNWNYDVFVHDRRTGVTTRASVASGGVQIDSESSSGSISADGRYVSFRSEGDSVVPGDTNVSADVFVHDRITDFIAVAVDGADRYETAVTASRKTYEAGGTTTVLIASGENWPDALGGGALSGALDAPLLLVKPDELPASVAAEIGRLGASKAIILGGHSAVSDETMNALDALAGVTAERIGGSTRYETARLLAERTRVELGGRYDGVVLLATGTNYPDALAASALSAANCWPILLTTPTHLPPPTKQALEELVVSRLLVIGGHGAVSPAAEDEARTSTGLPAVRVAGANRFDTAVKIATYGVDSGGLSWNPLALTTGRNFPDALAAGCIQGRQRSVMLLTDSAALPPETAWALISHSGAINEVWFFGGSTAISPATRTYVADLLQ